MKKELKLLKSSKTYTDDEYNRQRKFVNVIGECCVIRDGIDVAFSEL